MKKIGLILVFALFAVFGMGVSSSFANPYVSGNFGLVFVNDADFSDPAVGSGEFTFDSGFGLLAAVGTSVQNGGRFEAELGYRSNDMDELILDSFGSFDIDGDVNTLSLMGNGYFDMSTSGIFTPFVGGGIGLANIEGDIEGAGDEDDTVFAYQLMLGGSFKTSETISIDLQYRFFATADPDFDGTEVEYSTHNVLIGLRSSF